MHAYYSWRYLEGFGYSHNPLLHGPLLFHLVALGFFLFPENDATARLMPQIRLVDFATQWIAVGRRPATG